MALTNTDLIAFFKEKYQIPDFYTNELTVYRSTTATGNQLSAQYLVGNDLTIPIFGTRSGDVEEVVIIGSHTLLDEDNVFEEYLGD